MQNYDTVCLDVHIGNIVNFYAFRKLYYIDQNVKIYKLICAFVLCMQLRFYF